MTPEDVSKRFHLAISNARCYLCNEKVGEARWHLGEVGDSQEVVHTECFDKKAKESQEFARFIQEVDELLDAKEHYFGRWSHSKRHEYKAYRPSDPIIDVGAQAPQADEALHSQSSYQEVYGNMGNPDNVEGTRYPAFEPGDGSVSYASVRHGGERE